MYKVRFSTKEEGVRTITWYPDGAPEECDETTALERYCFLYERGVKNEMVDNAVPYLVEIVDLSGALMYGITTAEKDKPVGAWVRMAA